MLTVSILRRLTVASLIACAVLAPVLSRANGLAAVTAAAEAEGVPVALARAVAAVESGFRCSASSGSSRGVMQVKAATARSVGVAGNLLDCRSGALAGVRYLRQALAVSGGNWAAAVHRYNAGVGARVRRTAYVARVMARAR